MRGAEAIGAIGGGARLSTGTASGDLSRYDLEISGAASRLEMWRADEERPSATTAFRFSRAPGIARQRWALDVPVSVPVAVATARILALAVSVLVVIPASEAVGRA